MAGRRAGGPGDRAPSSWKRYLPGFSTPAYILPSDHRGSFQSGMFGWNGTLSTEQMAQLAATRKVIYDGLRARHARCCGRAFARKVGDRQRC